MNGRQALGFLVGAAAMVGCAISVPPPVTPAEGPAVARQAWARLLAERVDESGRIDFAGIAREPRDLEVFVSWLAAVSPRSAPGRFPGREAVLAYSINAYNALAMYNVIRAGLPPELGSIKVRFFYRDRLLVGGEKISLYRLENSIIRPLREPRVHFALNCMVRGCPRLPRVPFDAATLDSQLDGAARLFFGDSRNVELDPGRRTVRFNEILRFYAKDFLEKAPSLIAYANRYRLPLIPADWKVEFLPYDWTLNQQ
jgi:hypothetical protein